MPYGGPPSSRGGYYHSMPMDRRGGHPNPMQMQMDSRMQPRYDPYRRPDFYDPYMMQRGAPPPPPSYYGHHGHHQDKMGASNGHQSRTQPPQRYSNPYNRR